MQEQLISALLVSLIVVVLVMLMNLVTPYQVKSVGAPSGSFGASYGVELTVIMTTFIGYLLFGAIKNDLGLK